MSTKKAVEKANVNRSNKKTADVAVQTENVSMNYISPQILSGFQLESEAYLSFFYKPHMVFLLVMLCSIIGYTAFTSSESHTDSSFIHNSRIGLIFALLVIIYYGALYFPSSLMQRPHYSLWRMILAGSICYCAIITFILFQVERLYSATPH